MSKQFPEMDQARITVDQSTRQRHLDSVTSAIQHASAPRLRRLRFLAVSLALVLLLPVIALASERSVPGDFLYPFKRAVEPITSVFDDDVAAEHRVEEVEILFDREAPSEVIHDHVDVAREAVSDHRSQLNSRIDTVVSELEQRDSQAMDATETVTEQGSDKQPTHGDHDRPATDDGGATDSGTLTHRDTTTTTVETKDLSRDRVRHKDG